MLWQEAAPSCHILIFLQPSRHEMLRKHLTRNVKKDNVGSFEANEIITERIHLVVLNHNTVSAVDIARLQYLTIHLLPYLLTSHHRSTIHQYQPLRVNKARLLYAKRM